MVKIFLIGLLVCIQNLSYGQVEQKSHREVGTSFYPLRMEDSEAVYFTPDKFDIQSDGKTDVSDALQDAINQVKVRNNFGVLFIPEGTYLISKTIYIPKAVRLIGYGKNRPLMVLARNSPGFQIPDMEDKGQAKYMFWFTSNIVKPGEEVQDAGAGTFYSAMSNINIKIEDGNPAAVALRTHYAQHSFISHIDIHIDNGKAGVFDVGNEMEDVRFFGGEYGIYTTKTSPGWPFMMLDTYFEGQRKAAIKTREAGLTIVRMNVKDVPTVIETETGFWEKLFMKDCRFENISGPALILSNENNAMTSISLRNIDCQNVPLFANYSQSGKEIKGAGTIYKVNFIDGLQIDNLSSSSTYKTSQNMQVLNSFPDPVITDIPDLPEMKTWVNLQSLGAKGDGITDDTKAIQTAINNYETIYVPQGWYRISETIKLKSNTVLIGLSPIGTQFILADNTEAFGSFGEPKPMVEAPEGGTTIISGIGLSTGASNPRAVACKWMAGADSYMNDIKFIGGHGSMNKPGQDEADIYSAKGGSDLWDSQYWSLWITGGGVFKNIWSASTFATSGVYVSNTSTKGRIYAMSVEHHVRNEVRFDKVSNWEVYALQLEEESRESSECQPLEMENCDNMVFANLYLFRVIRVTKPHPYAIRNWGSKNIEFLNVYNYSQTKYTTTVPLYDIHSDTEVRPWVFARLFINGDLSRKVLDKSDEKIQQLATGFEFAEGMAKDSKGNIYFCESRMKRIYKWSVETNSLSLVADYPWEPLSLACDKDDNLLVVFKYVPKPGYLKDGKPEVFTNPPDAAGTSFSGWGNSGFTTWVYSINPDDPDDTIHLLEKVKMNDIKDIYKALYPSHRRRDGHDFNTVAVARAEECWLAPDGLTIIPVVYDLARATALVEAFPNHPLYVADEYNKRTVKLSVGSNGYVSDFHNFVERGEFASATDDFGNVYVADGEIYVYNKAGEQIREIKVPERPTSLVFGGKDNKTLFIVGHNSLYSMEVTKI